MASTATGINGAPDEEVETEVNPRARAIADAGMPRPPEPDSGFSQAVYSATSSMTGTVSRLEPIPARWRLPVVGAMPVGRQIQILSAVLVLSLVAAAAAVYHDARSAARLAVSASTATTMQMLSQRVAKAAQQAVLGDPAGFDQLRSSREQFAFNLSALRDGNADLPPASGDAARVLSAVDARWSTVAADVDRILSQQANLLAQRSAEAVVASAGPRLRELTGALAVRAMDSAEPYPVRNRVMQLEAQLESFALRDAQVLLQTDRLSAEAAAALADNLRRFGQDLRALLGEGEGAGATAIGDPGTLAAARALAAEFTPFAAGLQGILASIPALAGAREATRNILDASEELLQLPGELTAIYRAKAQRRGVVIGAAVALGLLALVCVLLIGKVYLEDARTRAAQSDRDYRRNQEAIIRLLDEMQGLAEGNLTMRARVTDDITGTIADSVNFAVEELRGLVLGINAASTELHEATGEARGISAQLLKAAKRQTDEIRTTTAAVLNIAKSIKSVSERSDECVTVAGRSLAASEKGAAAVQASISGMNAIRDQIQETAKRIKRLGENSQEISEIVELIADITDQTNVLALNAAIQAASAGAAGRGFSVVAEEVQRLAERSAEATQQIAAIVKTIQTDTHDTVLAMEKSTQGVVEGTRVSDAAGQALNEIGEVSRQLAGMVEAISINTREQTEAARRAARSMHDILKITEATAAGTRRTNGSMERVSELVDGLSDSVSGFRI